MTHVGQTLRMLGRHDEAIRVGRQILAREKDDADALFLMGASHFALGNNAAASKALERFLARKEIVIDKLKEGGARVERIDARPLIREMVLSAPDCLRLTLRFGPKRTLKPEALLKEWLGPAPNEEFHVLRKDLLSETSSGELLTP